MNYESCVQIATARFKWWAWFLLTKGALGVIYVALIADALRLLVPPLGQKLHRLPMFGELKFYRSTYNLDLSPFLALFIAIAVWHLWERLLELWLVADTEADRSTWHGRRERTLVVSLAWLILGSDMLLFYVSVTYAGWGESTVSVSAVVATVSYVAVLVFFSYVSVTLSQNLAQLKKKGIKNVSRNNLDGFGVTPVNGLRPTNRFADRT